MRPAPTSILDLAPVIPVVVLEHAADAVPLARALVAGGLPAIEITLRTPAALEAINAVAEEVPEAVVGAGSVLDAAQARAALGHGAGFLVSPGTTPVLREAIPALGVPFLPGVATATEVMTMLALGCTELKFFPADACGGPAFLRSLAAPLPQARFCVTGGITAQTAADYLALPNVGCVGGSWMVPKDLLAARDWTAVEALAAAAAKLARSR